MDAPASSPIQKEKSKLENDPLKVKKKNLLTWGLLMATEAHFTRTLS